jgi:DNA-binding CsgD family transcriptional regulator
VRSFEDYVDRANAVTSEDELFKVFLAAVKRHGLDRALFVVATDHHDIDQRPGPAVIHNYPGDWMKYYLEQNFDKIDPVMVYGLTQNTSYTWDIIPARMKLKKRQMDCLNLGAEAGLHNGICTPLRGPNNQLAGISLASSEKSDGFDGKVDLITAYCNHFYISWKRFHQQKKGGDPLAQNPVLTETERDILTWAAKGKSDFDIGGIMNLSSHTVDWHMRNIFKKFGVNNRILVVVKALSYGLINP